VKIVYLIAVHKNPEQVVRLVRKLDTKSTSFYLHVDKKADNEIYRRLVGDLDDLPNVHFLKRRKVYWGHFGLLGAIIQGLEEIFNRNVSFNYIVFLTGQCYPIKSNSYIEKTLEESEPYSFIHHFPLPSARWQDEGRGGLNRVECWHIRVGGRTLRFPAEFRRSSRIVPLLWSALASLFPIKRKFPRGFHPFGGSNHWWLSRDCAEYVNNFVGRNPAFVNFFRFVLLPEEIFFQTLILNSPFKGRVINDDLKYICWPDNADRPTVLFTDDFESIAESSRLFARKFDISVDADVLDLIDQNLLNK